MKFIYFFILSIGILLSGGCHSQEQPASMETKIATPVKDSVQKLSKGPILADEKISNLQLEDPSIPVYDHFTVAERQRRGLPVRLPKLQEYSQKKVAYLTFDDGPEDKNTPAVLDILKENGVKATFYLVGKALDAYPDIVKRIYNEGHSVGNHTWSHDYDNLYSSPSNFIAELERFDEKILTIIGVRPFITRAPGGSMGQFDESYSEALKEKGYIEHDWNVSSADAAPNDPVAKDFIDNIDYQTADGRKCAIILMHSSAGHEETVKALPKIIRILKERGYSFGVVTPMTPDL